MKRINILAVGLVTYALPVILAYGLGKAVGKIENLKPQILLSGEDIEDIKKILDCEEV